MAKVVIFSHPAKDLKIENRKVAKIHAYVRRNSCLYSKTKIGIFDGKDSYLSGSCFEFEIKYVYKENGGMHTGHNKAYELIDTELNVCIDSDDFMPDNSVELIVDFWSKYGSNRYSGIVSLDNDDKGNIIGAKLPNKKSIKLCDFYDMGGKGDKNLIYRTDIMKKYPPYPEFQG